MSTGGPIRLKAHLGPERPQRKFDILTSVPRHLGRRVDDGLVVDKWEREDIAHRYLDLAFAGQPGSCDAESCEKLLTQYNFQTYMSFLDADRYKYIIDVRPSLGFTFTDLIGNRII